MVVPIVRLYNQMPEPKYVLAMGACASGGGPFKEGYNVVSGIDKYLPVDVYVPGCPPTPQALLYGMIALQRKVDGQSLSLGDDVPWYGVGPSDPTPVPILGPDIIDPRQMDMIRRKAEAGAAQEATAVMDVSRALPVWRSPSLAAGTAADGGAATAEATVDIGDLQRIPGGKAPWEESTEIREARAANARKRKAIRAARRSQEG